MRFIKIFSVYLALTAVVMYFGACSSAEQTTAKLAYNSGDFKKAEIEFDKETKQNPSNEEAWFYLAMSRAQLGNADGVRTAIAQYKKLGKNSFNSELTQAWGTMYDKAYKQYEDGEKSVKAGSDADGIRKFQESLTNFEIAYGLLPDSAFVKDNISALNGRINTILVKPTIDKGVELEKAGNYEAAIAEYNTGLVKVTKGSGAYEVIIYNISLANLKWGEKLRTANENLDPEKQDTTYRQRYRDALPFLNDLTNSKDPCTQITSYNLLIQVYASIGMNNEASSSIETRDKLKSEHPECGNEEENNSEGTGFSFKNVSLQQNEGYLKIIGEVTSSEKSYSTAIFKISLYDGNSKLLETVDFVISNITKGQTKSFDALTTAKIKASDIKNYKIQFDNGY